MWCISAYEYVADEAKMTKIVAPSIFKSLVSQVRRRNVLSSAAVNSLGDILSPCCTPPLHDVDLVAFFVCGLSSSCLC